MNLHLLKTDPPISIFSNLHSIKELSTTSDLTKSDLNILEFLKLQVPSSDLKNTVSVKLQFIKLQENKVLRRNVLLTK